MGRKYDELKSKQLQRFEVFNIQDTENGFFDVTFQLGDEKLHAHKHMLAGLSKPFAVMFSDRWSNKDEAIMIDSYSYNDFKEFLNHFYFSECKLSNENIFTMVDMAEFYDVADMKVLCDEFLAKMEITPENVLQMFEFSDKYLSLSKFQSSVKTFMIQNLSSLVKTGDFLKIKYETLKYIAGLERSNSQEMEFFEAVYKWAENQAIIKQSSSDAETFDMNQAIKEEMADILPKIHFELMELHFLHKFVVSKGFLFSSFQELSDILQKAKTGGIYVTVVSSNGKTLTGKLSCHPFMFSIIYDKITSVKDVKSVCGYRVCQYWRINKARPSKSSPLKKNDNVKYYLLIDGSKSLAVKRTSQLDDKDYLLAELDGDDGFELADGCQIEAVYNF